jgi:hypothetical protein
MHLGQDAWGESALERGRHQPIQAGQDVGIKRRARIARTFRGKEER